VEAGVRGDAQISEMAFKMVNADFMALAAQQQGQQQSAQQQGQQQQQQFLQNAAARVQPPQQTTGTPPGTPGATQLQPPPGQPGLGIMDRLRQAAQANGITDQVIQASLRRAG
jgi:hypothetical protein